MSYLRPQRITPWLRDVRSSAAVTKKEISQLIKQAVPETHEEGDLFINKRKTEFNNLLYRMILNTKRIHNSFWRNFPARAKQMPSKVLFVGKKKRRPRSFGHRAPKL